MALQLSLAMVLVIVQILDQSAEAAWFQNMGFLELQSYAEESWTTLQPSKVSTYYINVFCSVRKSQQELVSMNCWGLVCQLLD